MVVGGLSMLFMEEERRRIESSQVKRPKEQKKRATMMSSSQEFSGSKTFKIPLHYPRYTKKQYEHMPEWKLDSLLQDYGLPIDQGDLAYKRELAISTFIWPEPHSEDGAVDSDKDFTSQGKKNKASRGCLAYKRELTISCFHWAVPRSE
uniref:DUF7722 domain-containing protein n=1 Tax=Manihot esculenta TaxID=3983 RepID=A0A2C9V2P6_MANES